MKGLSGSEFAATFAGTSWMGWGFSSRVSWIDGAPPMYVTVYAPRSGTLLHTHWRAHPYSASQAMSASETQLRADPVFRHNPGYVFEEQLDSNQINETLAKGIPALSAAMGNSFVDGASFSQFDLSEPTMHNSWPNEREVMHAWLHGDIQTLALKFVFPTYQTILTNGGLK